MKPTFDIHQKILEGARVAVAEAVETHRRLGQSIVVMRDGKPTWIAAEHNEPRLCCMNSHGCGGCLCLTCERKRQTTLPHP